MTVALKVAALLIIIGFIVKIVLANANTSYDEPCDYRECPTCPFPCERHRK